MHILLLIFVSAFLNQMSLYNIIITSAQVTTTSGYNITLTTFNVTNESVTIDGQNTTSETVGITIATTFDAGSESVATEGQNTTWLNSTANTMLNFTSMSMTQTTLVSPSPATTTQSTSSIVTTLDLVSTTPQPTLLCLGFLSDTGVCLCPDDWTNDTCNISHFCQEETLNGFTFPLSEVGQLTYSTELCPQGTIDVASVPMASAVCLNSTRSFGELQFMNCVWTLENLQDMVNASDTSVDKHWSIASSVQMLTSKPEQLTHENITSAATIARRLLSSNLLNKTIALAVVTTISQLMDAAHTQYSEDSYTAIENLTKTLEDFALHMSMNDTTSGGLVQPNLAIQYIKVPSGTPQVQFYTLTGLPDTFLGTGTEADNTRSSSGYPAEIQLTLHLQKDVQKILENQNVGIGVVMYKNDHFFKSKSFNMEIGTKRRVVSAGLTDKRILDHIKFNIMPKNISGVTPHSSACVYWDYTERDWSTEGCFKILTPSGGVQCKCNHTTNFAVLMSYKADYQYSEALNWISILGCSMSLVGLVLTVLYQIQTRKSRGTNSTMLLVNICVCMTFFYLIFMFGINNPIQHKNDSKSLMNVVPASDWHQALDEGPCTPVTALLQYFLLATFTWNIMYAAHVFFLIRNALNGPPAGFLAFAITAGWGLPALIVGISLGTTYSSKDPLGYRQEEFCWLASLDKEGRFDPKRPMLWGFLLPLAVMLSFNIAVLVYFSLTICRAKPNLKSSRTTPLKKKILSSFSLAVVLGLSWVIGYFVLITHDKTLYIILSALFCLCNTTQGVQIFIFFTLKPFLQKKARYNTDLKTESNTVP